MCPVENKGKKKACSVGEWKKARNFCHTFQPSGNIVRLAEVNMVYSSMQSRIFRFPALRLLLIIIMPGTLVSCGKDELTEPATLHFGAKAGKTAVMEGALVIDRLELNISKLDISGRRVSENDMYFTRNLNKETGYFALLPEVAATTTLQIPQGAYQTLVFYTTLREEDYEFESGSTGEDDETGDLQEYITKAKPGLLLLGRYTQDETSFPVVVSLNDDIRRIAIDATQGGLPSVTLQKEIASTATLMLDAAYLFVPVTHAMLENAQSFMLNGEQAVVISEEYNTVLYSQLAGRIQGAVTLTIENQ